MAKNVFGLDIGSSLLKVVKLETRGNTKVLLQAGVRPAPPKGLQSESALDLEAVVRAIKDLVTSTKINTKYVNIALPENQVFTRVIDVPNLTDKELSSAIQWEAEQYIPSPLSEVVLDYQVVERSTNPQDPMQVLLVASPIVLINKYKKILSDAGLIPFVFETALLSMARVLVRDKEQATMLVVDIGAQSSTLAVVRKGVLRFTYTLATGGDAITRSLAGDFEFELTKAEEYKKTYGLEKKPNDGKVASAITPIVNIILAEIEKSIAFYQKKYPQEQINYIILSGGTAKLPGLVPYLANAVGIEVEIANPWNGIIVDETVFRETLKDGPLFLTASGLALRDYE